MGDIGSGIAGLFGAGTAAAQQSQDTAQFNKLSDTLSNADTQLLGNYQSLFPDLQSLVSGGMNGTGLLGGLQGLGSQLASLFPQFSALSGQQSGLAGQQSGLAGQIGGLASSLANANLFPSAGMSAMKTMLAQDGSVANPGAQMQQLASTLGQEGMAGDLSAKQAAMGGLSSAISGLGSSASTLGQAGSTLGQGGSMLTGAGSLNQSSISDILNAIQGSGSLVGSGLSSLGNLAGSYMNQANLAGQGVQAGLQSAMGSLGGSGSGLGGLSKASVA